MDNKLKAALDLAQNPMHQYLMGELAAALLIATEALGDITDSGRFGGTSTKATASQALKAIHELSDNPERLGQERLKNLFDEYAHLRSSGWQVKS